MSETLAQVSSTIVKLLEPLSSEERTRVMQAALLLLGDAPLATAPASDSSPPIQPPDTKNEAPDAPIQKPEAKPALKDVRSFFEVKKPKSQVEAAATIAYFLSELAPADERSEVIDNETFEKYCKLAKFELPNSPRTLANTKAAGYLESAGRGKYKLNAVGHNLVAHRLPRD